MIESQQQIAVFFKNGCFDCKTALFLRWASKPV